MNRLRFNSATRICWMLVSLAAAWLACLPAARAVTPEATSGNATVSGTYKLQLTHVKMVSWYKQKNCTVGGKTTTYTAGGSEALTEVEFGTATFNGSGTWQVTMTEMPVFDQTKSNATASITCPATSTGSATINNGSAVFDAPVIKQLGGTYTVSSAGVLTMLPSGSTSVSDGMTALLTQYNASGVATVLLMQDGNQKDNPTTGIAIHK